MLKLANSTDPAVMAENIVHLRDAIDDVALPNTSEATTGQVLTLTGENKTPAWADSGSTSTSSPLYIIKTLSTSGSLAILSFMKILNGKAIYFTQVHHNDPSTFVTNFDGFSISYSDGWKFDYPNVVIDGEEKEAGRITWTYTDSKDFTCYTDFETEASDVTTPENPEERYDTTPPPTETGTGSIVGGPYTDLYEEPEAKKTTKKKTTK